MTGTPAERASRARAGEDSAAAAREAGGDRAGRAVPRFRCRELRHRRDRSHGRRLGFRNLVAYRDLRDFIAQLEARGELKRVAVEVDPQARDDRALRSRAQGRRSGAAVRAPTGHSPMPVLGNLFGTPQRVARAMGVDGDDWRSALREIGKLLAFLKEPEPPKGLVDAWQNTRPVFMKVLDMAPKERSSGAMPGSRLGRRRRRPRAAAGADLLAGRRRAAHHVGPDRHARAAQEAAEPRHLPAAGDRAQQGDHALARASRRRARLPRSCARASGHAVSGRGRARRRSGDDPRRGDAGARYAVRVPVRGPAARRAHRARQVPDARPAGAGDRGDRARRPSHARRVAIRRATRPPSKVRSAITPATTTRSSAFRCSPSSA